MYSNKELLRQLEEIVRVEGELEEMSDNWNSDDPLAQASSDPGLQFELSQELGDLESEFYGMIKANLKRP